MYVLRIAERRSMNIDFPERRESQLFSTSPDQAVGRADVLGRSLYNYLIIKSSVFIYLVLCSLYSASAAYASESV